ncbi:conserved Plasmodium protein, unknown function [Plasmodium reichenowi]|uniref:Uncharacterized protein n=1 Tax=Plasmodium reichenowi TaxID=5854 RepID=A0A2P9D2Q8_PLARE|nr:conserved Plasmodium protein, unknown function [Plasmodium reichenowi]
MNVSVTIKGNLSNSSSEKNKNSSKKNDASIFFKFKKENLDKKKIIKNNIVRKEKNSLNKKGTSNNTTNSFSKGNNIKLSGDPHARNVINEKKNLSEKKNGFTTKYDSKKSYSSKKSSLLNKLPSSEITLNKSNLNFFEKKKSKDKQNVNNNINGSKLINYVDKLYTNNENINNNINEKKSSNIFTKNIQKKNKTNSSNNLNTSNVNKKTYKLGNVLAQPEKFIRKKKNKIIKNLNSLKRNIDIMMKSEQDQNILEEHMSSVSSSSEKKKKNNNNIEQNENMEKLEKNGDDNIYMKDNKKNDEQKGDNNTKEQIHINDDDEKKIFHDKKNDMENNTQETKTNIFQDNTVDTINGHICKDEKILFPYFIEATYDKNKDIFNEKYDDDDNNNNKETNNLLLPGYHNVTFENLSENNKMYNINNINNINNNNNNNNPEHANIQINNYPISNNIYATNSSFPPYKFISYLRPKLSPKAYHLKNNEILNNFLFTSADITRGTIHQQYNMTVTYPYGVPYINMKNKINKK